MNNSVNITFGKEKFDVEIASMLVAELQLLLEKRTGVFTRQQKLLCKGRVLGPTEKLQPGAKIMLLSSGGPVVPTQGQQSTRISQ